MSSTLTKPIPCRFHEGTKQRIALVAEKFGMKPAAIIRFAVDAQLESFERENKIVINSRNPGSALNR